MGSVGRLADGTGSGQKENNALVHTGRRNPRPLSHYCFFTYEVKASIETHHIRYQMLFPNLGLRRALYVPATLAPLFLSSLKWMKLLGSAFLGSLILTFIFYTYCVISVWCFFAALLSALVLLVITTYNKTSKL